MRIQGGGNNYTTGGVSQMNSTASAQKLAAAQKTGAEIASNKVTNVVDNSKISQVNQATSMKTKQVNTPATDATATTDTTKKATSADELRSTFQKNFSDLLKSGKDFDTTFKEAEKLFDDYFSAMRGLPSANEQGNSSAVQLTKAQNTINTNRNNRLSFNESGNGSNIVAQNSQTRNNIDVAVNMSNNITNSSSRINDIKNVEMEQVNQMQISQSVLAQANQASQTVLGLMS